MGNLRKLFVAAVAAGVLSPAGAFAQSNAVEKLCAVNSAARLPTVQGLVIKGFKVERKNRPDVASQVYEVRVTAAVGPLDATYLYLCAVTKEGTALVTPVALVD